MNLNLQETRRELSSRPLRATSGGRSWSGLSLDRFDAYTVRDMIAPPRDHHVVTAAIGRSGRVLQHRHGKSLESVCLPGEITMIPAGYKGRWDGLLPAHIRIAVAMDDFAECVAGLRQAGGGSTELTNGFRVQDPFLKQIAQLFAAELEVAAHPAQDLFLGSLAQAFSIHLVRHYTQAAGVEERRVGHAHPAAIRRAIAFIHDHSHRAITLEDIATAAGLSRFHFSRMFRKATGTSPARYLENQRIDVAKMLLQGGAMTPVEVAQATGFADPRYFTRRFFALVGCRPGDFGR
jgi:AraC family transcriptional regulator